MGKAEYWKANGMNHRFAISHKEDPYGRGKNPCRDESR